MEWEKGFDEALFYLGNTTYEGVVDGISDNEIKIINQLKLFEVNKIIDIKNSVNINSINEYLRRLVDKGILKALRRGEYIINDKMLWEYLHKNHKNHK